MNNYKRWYDCKKCHVWDKDYVWNSTTCNCENGKSLASNTDDSVITCDVIIESLDQETTCKKATCKTQNFTFIYSVIDSC